MYGSRKNEGKQGESPGGGDIYGGREEKDEQKKKGRGRPSKTEQLKKAAATQKTLTQHLNKIRKISEANINNEVEDDLADAALKGVEVELDRDEEVGIRYKELDRILEEGIAILCECFTKAPRELKDEEREEKDEQKKKGRGRPSQAEQLKKAAETQKIVRQHINMEDNCELKIRKKPETSTNSEEEDDPAGTTIKEDEGEINSEKEAKRLEKEIQRRVEGTTLRIAEIFKREIKDLRDDLKKWLKEELITAKHNIWKIEEKMNEESKQMPGRIKKIESETEENKKEEEDWRVQMERKIEKREEIQGPGASKRMMDINHKLEMMDRKVRRNNIVISGANLKEKNLREEVVRFMDEKMKVKVRPVKVISLKGWNNVDMDKTLVELDSRDTKIKVLKNRGNLKGTKIYIDDDLTRREREIQKCLRVIASDERKKGHRTRVRYQKIEIDGERRKWDERRGGLERSNFRSGRLERSR